MERMIAIVQPKPTMQKKKLVQYVQRAYKEEIDLILFPEGFLPSYTGKRAITLNDEIIHLVREMTFKYHLTIGTGIKEKMGNKRYLSLILAHDGEIMAIHRKVILANFEEKAFDAGKMEEAFPVTEIKGIGKIGLALCYENLFPEVYRILKLRGAEIVLGPSGFGMQGNFYGRQIDYYDQWLTILRANAIQNRVYIATATNAIGRKFMGVVINPFGDIISDADDHEYAHCGIDLSLIQKSCEKLFPRALNIDFHRLPPSIYASMDYNRGGVPLA